MLLESIRNIIYSSMISVAQQELMQSSEDTIVENAEGKESSQLLPFVL